MNEFILETKSLVAEEISRFYDEKQLLSILEYLYSNRKAKAIDVLKFESFFEVFKISMQPINLEIRGCCVSYLGSVLFILEPTKAVEHNASCVIRDLINIFYQGDKIIYKRDVDDMIVFQSL
jgi:hypothetical protein